MQWLEHSGAEHRREREGDESGKKDGHRERNAELIEQPSDRSGEKCEGDEHGNQGDGCRQDGKSDLLASVKSGLKAALPHFHVAVHVFQDDDRIVDDKPDCQHQRQKRQDVEREPRKVGRRKGADDGDGYRQGRNRRRPKTLEEGEDHKDHQAHGDDQRLLHLVDRAVDEG